MLTRMAEEDWAVAQEVFRVACSRRGDRGRDDRRFLEALHYFAVQLPVGQAQHARLQGRRRLPGQRGFALIKAA